MATALRPGGALDGLARSPQRLRRIYRSQNVRRRGPHEGWHQIGQPGEPQFGPLWRNAITDPLTGYRLGQAPAGFYKDNDSLVWFRGVIEGRDRAWEHLIFTLPVGYRPAYTVVLLTAYEPIAFLPSGAVVAQGERKNASIKNGGLSPTAPKAERDAAQAELQRQLEVRRVFSLEALSFRAGN